MNQERFEKLVLQMWVTSRVPLTRANLLVYSHAPRRKLDGWLDEMVRDGVLDVDSDDQGEMLWNVRGAERPATGFTRVEELLRLQQLKAEAHGSTALVASGGSGNTLAARISSRLAGLDRTSGEKNIIVSGLLSFFFGPLGWLYAGSFRETVPALLGFVLLAKVLPFLLPYLFFLAPVMPLSAVVGVLYAMRHNQVGHRAPLLLDDDNNPRALIGKR